MSVARLPVQVEFASDGAGVPFTLERIRQVEPIRDPDNTYLIVVAFPDAKTLLRSCPDRVLRRLRR